MKDRTEISQGEALQRIKAEILAFDWFLNQRRIDLLVAAFAAVKGALPGRRGYGYVLGMAGGTLAYLERHGDEALPEVLDFFKQALAYLVTMLEEGDLSQAREAEIFHLVHDRFKVLKKKVTTAKRPLLP
ncbi:MAG: hypothetical protein ABFQ82_06385 [Thermodesulfobacteriota bacterium]